MGMRATASKFSDSFCQCQVVCLYWKTRHNVTSKKRVSRRQLEFHKFESKDENNWILVLTEFYADLFAVEEPDIMKKSNTGWRESKKPGLQYAFFKNLIQNEIERINSFIDFYRKSIVLDLNEHIENEFENELDFCIALGKPADKPQDLLKGKRSELGELVYLAKYKKKSEKADELALLLVSALNRVVKRRIAGRFSVSFVPSDSYADFYLPKYLAEKVISNKGISILLDYENPVIEAKLKSKPDKLKNVSMKAKLHICRELYTTEKVVLATSVTGRNIVIIDDLYQSGATLWSYARYLKSMGAHKVLGLVCEKNFRDSDNL